MLLLVNMEDFEHPLLRMGRIPENMLLRDKPERDAGHERVQKILRKINFFQLSITDKIKQLHSMNAEDFYILLSHLNGYLRNMKPKEYPHKTKAESADIILDKENLSIDYFVPLHSRELLNDFFLSMQKEISTENLKRYAVKLEYAIVFAHPFEDGNGRTSRYSKLLLEGQIPQQEDSATTLGHHRESTAALLAKLSIFELFKQELPEDDSDIIEINKPKDVRDYVFLLSDNIRDYGYGKALQALAFRKTFSGISLSKLYPETTEHSYWNKIETDSEAKPRYDIIYTELQNKLFWKVQEIIDRETDVDKLKSSLVLQIEELGRKKKNKENF